MRNHCRGVAALTGLASDNLPDPKGWSDRYPEPARARPRPTCMPRFVALAGGLLLALGTVTACGDAGDPASTTTATVGAATTPATAPASPTTASRGPTRPTPDPRITSATSPVEETAPPPGRAGPTTLTGTLDAGVEAGCRVLIVDGQTFQLVGQLRGVDVGRRVTVTGYADPTLATTCQQGMPFVVRSVATASAS